MERVGEIKLSELSSLGFSGKKIRGVLNVGDNKYNYFFSYKENSKSLNVFFPGAYQRSKGEIQFQRHTWVDYFDGHALVIDDPTINKNNDLSLGWFQGRNGKSCFLELEELIRKFCDVLSIELKDLLLFGSSAGGYTSLKLAEKINESSILCINPQVNVLNYSKGHVDRMLEYSYGVKNRNSITPSLVSENLVASYTGNRKGKIYYFQNLIDKSHVVKHQKIYVSGLCEDVDYGFFDYESDAFNSSYPVNIIYYTDELNGHSPPGLEETVEFFKYVGLLRGE